MPRKPRQFVNGEVYHIIVRRVGNEMLFIDTNDYYRGIFSIYEFNTTKPITIRERRAVRAEFKKIIREFSRGQTPVRIVKIPKSLAKKAEGERDLLVEIFAFCFMPNHIHLLVRQLKERGISIFMQKLNSGYAAYFKNKYGVKIRGHFFQDRFGAVHIKTEDQLRIVFAYIHTNPISLVEPQWKELGIVDPGKASELVENYKWSSYGDYIGKKNFPSLTEREFMLKVMNRKKGCRGWVEGWIKRKKEIREIMKKFSTLVLE